MTIREQLTAYLFKNQEWIAKGALTEMKWYHTNSPKTYLPESVGRELRDMEVESIIGVKDDGVSVQYKYLPKTHRQSYIPTSMRWDKDQLFLKDGEKLPKKRTLTQNASLHLGLQHLAEALNDAGLDMKKVLKPEVDIPWTKDTCKKYLFKPILDAYLEKESTKEMETAEVSKVWDIMMRHLSEKFGVYTPFPSDEPQMLQDLSEQ